MQSNKISYRYITVWREEPYPDLIFGVYAPRLEINLPIAHELIENRLEYSGGRAAYFLIDFTNVKSVTKEARDFMNSPDGGLKGVLGGAFVSNNVVSTILVNLYLKVSCPIVPAKFFTDRHEALRWLIKIRKEQSIDQPL